MHVHIMIACTLCEIAIYISRSG